MSNKHSIYHKDVSNLKTIDVYRIIDLYKVTDPGAQHAVKKLLCAGERGPKSFEQDLREASDAIERSLQMVDEDNREESDDLEDAQIRAMSGDAGEHTLQVGKVTVTFTGPPASGKSNLKRCVEDMVAKVGANCFMPPFMYAPPMPTAPAQAAPACLPMPAQAPAPEKPATVVPAPAVGPYTQGREACRKGSAWNPYKVGSIAATQWQNGYEDEVKQAPSKMPEAAVPAPQTNAQWDAELIVASNQGKAAFGAGKTIANNPYRTQDQRYGAWLDGFKSQLA